MWCKRVLALAVVLVALNSCGDGGGVDQLTAPGDLPSFVISDAAHPPGRAGFYFRPPLVPDASPFPGTFDPNLSPVARVCTLSGGPTTYSCTTTTTTIATFNGSTGSAALTVDTKEESYNALWKTPKNLTQGQNKYRLEVRVGMTLLGYLDFWFVKNSKELQAAMAAPNADQYVIVVAGNNVPIKFRIEETAPPVAADDAYAVAEDNALVVGAPGVLGNDSDPEGDPITAVLVSGPSNGGLVLNADGSFTYTPNANFHGSDSFTYQANDGLVGSNVATVSITVTPVNDAPVAADAAETTDEDVPVDVTLSATDVDLDALTFSIVSGPANGTLGSISTPVVCVAGTCTATVKYTPNAGVSGPDAFTYKANDGTVDSNVAMVDITVNAVDNAPTAVDDAATVAEDAAPTAIDVLANDTDPDGGPKSVVSVTQPANGTVVITGGGTGLTYQPNVDYCNDPPGTTLDTFTYTLTPGGSTATVSVTVTCVDDPPTAVDDAATVLEDDAATAIAVLANDTDVDGGSISIASVTQPANGTVAITGGGTGLTYQPDPDYCNDGVTTDDFTYTLSPGSSTATVSVTVTCVNDAPSFDLPASPDQSAPADGGAQTVTGFATNISAGPANESGQVLTFNVSNDDNTLFSVQPAIDPATGNLTYTPSGTPGSATVSVYLSDDGGTANGGDDTSDTQTFQITILLPNQAPVSAAQSVTTDEDAAKLITLSATDGDEDELTFSIVTGPTNGTLGALGAPVCGSGTCTATVTYTPNADYNGSDSFTFKTNDGTDDSAPATVDVTIDAVNDLPVAGADAFDFIGNTELRVDLSAVGTPHALETTGSGMGVLGNDSDPVEGDPVSIVGIVGCADTTAPFDCAIAGVGRVVLEATGRFSFVPEPGDAGATESFEYILSDGTDPVNGTVTLTRHERVWYIDNSGAAGNGTSTAPFNAITAANLNDNDGDGDLTDDMDSAGDFIFVYFGNGSASGLSGGLFLESGQHLIGEHAGLSLNLDLNGNTGPINLVAASPGNRPFMDDNVADGFDGVAARNVAPAEIVGMNLAGSTNAIDWTTTAAFAGTGTFSIRDNVIRSAGSEGVDANLAGTAGLNLGFHDNVITSTGTGLDIQETGTGSLTITHFDDNVVSGNTGGSGIVVNNAIFDATPGGGFNTVNGGTTAIGASGDGVGGVGLSLGNVQGDVHFGNLNIFADGGAGLTVAGTGAGMQFRVNSGGGPTGTIVATGGPAVDASSTGLDLRLAGLTSTNSSATGVSLTNVTGTFSAAAGSSINNATGMDFAISGGNANVAYAGTITDDVGQLVSVSNTTGGTRAFTGAITDGDDTDGSGISLSSAAGSTTFSGGLILSTGSNAAFVATGGGTVAVCDENPCNAGATGALVNKITTTTGTALNVANTNIGANNLEFRNISAGTGTSGPTTGIVLNTTGSSGGLKVNGTGGAGSGGTIQRATGPGIQLTSTSHVSLSYMSVQNGGDDGIRGSTVNNLDLQTVSVTSNGNAVGEHGIELSQLTGSGSMANVTVSGSGEHNVSIANTSGTLSAFNVTNSSFTTTNMTTGGDGVLVENNGTGAMTVSITGSTFTDNKGDHFQAATTAGASGLTNITFSNNTLSTTAANDPNVVGGGITISPSGASDFLFTISNNNLQQAFDEAINLNLGTASTAAASMIGTVSGNIIGTAGDVDSGSESGTGISVISNGAGLTTVAVTNNQVRQYANPYGILINTKEGSSNLNATVTGNTVANPGSFAINGIRVDAGATAGDSGTLCAAVTGNSVADSGPGADTDIRLRQRFNTTIRLPGYGGANNDLTAVNSFVAGNNAGSDVSSAHNVGGGGFGFVGGAACITP
jgi:hypothetical protein